MRATDSPGEIMLIVELNFAGYQFTREIPDLRRASFRSVRLSRHGAHWRIPQLRHMRAA
ncbi:MAG: hypothetical protein JO082_00675 [Mycobacterium sp.]|nr:hypothetical protein [Mycobacterium sp.]